MVAKMRKIMNKLSIISAVTGMVSTFLTSTPYSSAFAFDAASDMYYVKGGIGYNFSKFATKDSITSVNTKGYVGALGGGYTFTPKLRGEITARYTRGDYKKSTAVYDFLNLNTTGKFTQTQIAGLLNLYYQFSTRMIVSPYVGIGGGLQMVKNKVTATSQLGAAGIILTNKSFSQGATVTTSDLATSVSSKNKTAFMYQGALGLSCELDDGISLDVEYNLNNRDNGKVPGNSSTYITVINASNTALINSVSTVNDEKTKTELSHTVMLNLRMSL